MWRNVYCLRKQDLNQKSQIRLQDSPYFNSGQACRKSHKHWGGQKDLERVEIHDCMESETGEMRKVKSVFPLADTWVYYCPHFRGGNKLTVLQFDQCADGSKLQQVNNEWCSSNCSFILSLCRHEGCAGFSMSLSICWQREYTKSGRRGMSVIYSYCDKGEGLMKT